MVAADDMFKMRVRAKRRHMSWWFDARCLMRQSYGGVGPNQIWGYFGKDGP